MSYLPEMSELVNAAAILGLNTAVRYHVEGKDFFVVLDVSHEGKVLMSFPFPADKTKVLAGIEASIAACDTGKADLQAEKAKIEKL